MKTTSQAPLRRPVLLLIMCSLLLACWLPWSTTPTSVPAAPEGAAAAGQPSQTPPAQSAPSASTPPAAETAAGGEADPLDRLLTLRSIQFNLTSLRWDKTSRSLDVEIDNAGNMHIHYQPPAVTLENAPQGFDPQKFPNDYTLLVVDGKGYAPDDQNPDWVNTPAYADYLPVLKQFIHGPDSPALWLDLLPTGSIHAAGKEAAGGFDADKYTVDGAVNGQKISGAVWFEPQADALIQADLQVPAALFFESGKAPDGVLKISLHTQKADIPPIRLPGVQPGAPEPSAAPSGSMPPSSSSGLQTRASYPLLTKQVIGQSMIINAGKAWIGTLQGTLQAVDLSSGDLLQTVLLAPGAGTPYPIIRMGFDGQHIWALGNFVAMSGADHLYVIDPQDGKVIQQWDLTQPDWQSEHGTAYEFGFSPGKVWTKLHIIDTQTFSIQKVGMPGFPHFAYDGKGWMWMTGFVQEACDELIFHNVDNPSETRHQCHWPFLKHGETGARMDSPLVLAGNQMWIAGVIIGKTAADKPTYTLEAYPADLDQLMAQTKPLRQIPLVSENDDVRMVYAGGFLWLLAVRGEKNGYLFQLDPQTGDTLNSLDLRKDHGDTFDMASDGSSLWVLTRKDLVQVTYQ